MTHQLISARLQDIIGKREIFLLGMIIYGVGDLIAALSPNAMVLDKNTKLCVLLVAVSIAAFLAFEIFELRYSEAGKQPEKWNAGAPDHFLRYGRHVVCSICFSIIRIEVVCL